MIFDEKRYKRNKKNLECGRDESCLVLKNLFLAIEYGVLAVKKFDHVSSGYHPNLTIGVSFGSKGIRTVT